MDDVISLLSHCELCPRRCGADRLAGRRGFCGCGADCVVAHYGLHFGEEPPISGTAGSGTVFFSPCNMRCVFCQNHQISQAESGRRLSVGELADVFVELAREGAHNINLVSPTPYAPRIASAIRQAKGRGVAVPFLYNTNAYENVGTVRMFDGLVDIYMPDLKYWGAAVAERLSAAPGYPEAAREAIREMKAQVGDLVSVDGVARRGLLVRHLVLPGGLAGSRRVIGWIAETLGTGTALSLMSQYYPTYRARGHRLLGRRIRPEEYEPLVDLLSDMGFANVFVQEMESSSSYRPDFSKTRPFGR